MRFANIRVVRKGHSYELERDSQSIEQANAFIRALELRGLSRCTLRAYAYDLLVLYRWLATSERDFEKLAAVDLISFIAFQREVGAAPRSINRRLSTIRLAYRFCTDQELGNVPGAASAHYKGPGRDRALGLHRLRKRTRLGLRVKESHTLIEPLSPQQVRSFLRSLERYRDLAIVHAMLLCGLRSKEVIDMELADVAFDERIIRVRGKGDRERTLPLPEALAQTIRQYLAFERPRRCSEPRLFVVLQGQGRGQPMSPAGLRSLFRRRRKRPALRIANAHRFRHTFGADMTRFGMRVPILQRLMGHADLKTTLGYVRLSVADVAEEYQRALAQLRRRYGQR